jgi:hypothetical protein
LFVKSRTKIVHGAVTVVMPLPDEVMGLRTRIDELVRPVEFGRDEAVEARRRAFCELEPMVCRHLAAFAPAFSLPRPVLTVYDAVYPATPSIGAHWTLSRLLLGTFFHGVDTCSIAVAFDEANRPDHFVVSGSMEIVTPDVREASLESALAVLRASGPAHAFAPHVFAGLRMMR